jgi:hypothetical protein
MESVYLLRYGAMGRLVPATATADAHALERGDRVVAVTPRGAELAEVLAPLPRALVPDAIGTRIVRPASAADLEAARAHAARTAELLGRCEAIVAEVAPGLTVLDAELLLDGSTLVAYALGDLPDAPDLPGMRAAIRMRHGLDVILEPLGADAGAGHEDAPEGGGGGCGSGGCGSGSGGCGPGGCGTRERIASWAASRA